MAGTPTRYPPTMCTAARVAALAALLAASSTRAAPLKRPALAVGEQGTSLPVFQPTLEDRFLTALLTNDATKALELLRAGADPNRARMPMRITGADGAVRDETFVFVPLLEAISRARGSPGELELVEALLERGADPNVVMEFGPTRFDDLVTRIRTTTVTCQTPLSVALSPGARPADRVRLVELLLRRGARPGPVPERVESPISQVAFNRPGVDEETRWRLWTALAASGADLVRSDREGAPATTLLAQVFDPVLRAGNLRMVRDALARGAKVDARGGRGRTTLGHAAARGDLELARTLLDAGADPNARDDEGATPLMLAGMELDLDGRLAELRALLRARGADLGARDRSGNTALHRWAALCGFLPAVEWALQEGADPQVANGEGVTPLGTARSWGCPKTAALLEKRGGKSFAWSWPLGNREPAAAAILARDAAALERLPAEAFVALSARLESGAVVTPLHLAAAQGDAGLIALLGRRRLDWNARDLFRRTPLHVAVERGDRATAEALLRLGADPSAEDLEGQTPLSRAAAREPAIARALLAGGARAASEAPLAAAMAAGDPELVRLLLPVSPLRPALLGLAIDLGSEPILAALLERIDPQKDAPAPPDPGEPWAVREYLNPAKGTAAQLVARTRAAREEQERFRREAEALPPPPPSPGAAGVKPGERLLPLERWSPWIPAPEEAGPRGFSVAAYVPPAGDGKEPYGLIVFMWGRRSTPGYPSAAYRKVLDRHRLIWVGFSAYDVGPESRRPTWSHAAVALAAVAEAQRQLPVDPRRVYLGGLSWGGRQASRIATAMPERFRGALAMGGALRTAIGPQWPLGRERLRLVFTAGDADYNRDEAYRAWSHFVAEGYRRVHFLLDPVKLHEALSPEAFERAVGLLVE
jgi:cytohesin